MGTDTIYPYYRACRGKVCGIIFLYFIYSGHKNCPLQHELTYFLLRIILFGVLRQITVLAKIGEMLH